MGGRSGLDFLILVCALLIFLIAYHIGLIDLPLGFDIAAFLMISVGILASTILLGCLGRRNRMAETTASRFGRINSMISIGAIVVIGTIVLALVGVYPPGMDPEVPFLFVIPAFAMLIFYLVLFEEATLSIELAQSHDLSNKNRYSVGQSIRCIVLLSFITVTILAWSVYQSWPPPIDAADALLSVFPITLCTLFIEMEFMQFKKNKQQI